MDLCASKNLLKCKEKVEKTFTPTQFNIHVPFMYHVRIIFMWKALWTF